MNVTLWSDTDLMRTQLKQQILSSVENLGGFAGTGAEVLAFQPRTRQGNAGQSFIRLDAQYGKLAEIIEESSPQALVATLAKIISFDDFRFQDETLQFCPLIRKQLEEILVREYDALVAH